MNDLILYTTESGRSQIKLRVQGQIVRLTQLENIFAEGKPDADSVVKESLTTAADGNLSEIPTGSQNPKQWRPCHG